MGEIGRDDAKSVDFNLKVSKNVIGSRVILVVIESENLSWNYEVPIYVLPYRADKDRHIRDIYDPQQDRGGVHVHAQLGLGGT